MLRRTRYSNRKRKPENRLTDCFLRGVSSTRASDRTQLKSSRSTEHDGTRVDTPRPKPGRLHDKPSRRRIDCDKQPAINPDLVEDLFGRARADETQPRRTSATEYTAFTRTETICDCDPASAAKAAARSPRWKFTDLLRSTERFRASESSIRDAVYLPSAGSLPFAFSSTLAATPAL
jgi:hypothetical protein